MSRFSVKPAALLCALGIMTLGASTTAHSENLLDIYELAQTTDPVFQQAIANRRALEEVLPQARAALRPDISLDANYSLIDSESDLSGTDSDEQYRQLSYGVSLSQPLYRSATRSAVNIADFQVEQAQAEFAFAEQELILRVAERYFAVLDAREALDAAEASLAAIERQLEQAEQRFEVGVIARTDVEEARAQSDIARAERLQAEDDLETRREELRALTNRAPGMLDAVREGISLTPPEPADADEWRAQAEDQNHELTAARLAAEAAMKGIDLERGGRQPTVDLVAGFDGIDRYDVGDRDPSSDQYSAGIQINLPLYQGGEISSQIREAQFRYTEALEALEGTRRTVSRNTANAYRGVITALERVRALEQARISTQAALDATQAGFDVGTRTIVDVLNAERERFNAERDYEQARHAYLLNTLRLQQAAGSLSGEDLVRVNGLLGQ